jgi:SOS-response transcriptional repressor LexA
MKRVHIVGNAYSEDFFDLPLEDEEISLKPWIDVAQYHVARFGLYMDDDGLAEIGIESGDYLLISDFSTEPIFGKPILVRQEGKFIVRIAADVNPVECTLTTPNDVYPPLVVPSENIRIVGVVSGIIKGAKFEFE